MRREVKEHHSKRKCIRNEAYHIREGRHEVAMRQGLGMRQLASCNVVIQGLLESCQGWDGTCGEEAVPRVIKVAKS